MKGRTIKIARMACIAGALVAAPAYAGTTSHAPIAAPIDLAAEPHALRTVPDGYRPWFRWWWPRCGLRTEELAAGIDAMQAAGFGGAEQILMGAFDAGNPLERLGYIPGAAFQQLLGACWFEPIFRDRLRAALVEAQRRNFKLDVTMGPGWPPQSPAITPDLAVQALTYGAVDLVGGVPFAGAPPRALPGAAAGISTPGAGVQTGLQDRLVAVTAAKVVGGAAGGKPVQLDPSSAIDLTGRLSGGVLQWTPPEPGAHYKLFGFWQRPNGGTIPDHLNETATHALLADYDQRVFGELGPLLRANGGDVFEDSPEFGVGQNIFWTGDLLGETRRRRGYELTPYLPALFLPGQNTSITGTTTGPPDFEFTGDLGRRLRYDYYRTLTDLFIDEHVGPVRKWANERGMHSRIQPGYGVTMGVVRAAAASERPDHETLFAADPAADYGTDAGRHALDQYREVSSGAHLGATTSVVGSELGARLTADHEITIQDYKAWGDRSFAGGITRILVHGFNVPDLAHVPWPGYHAFAGLFSEAWDPQSPMLRGIRGLAGYWGRASAALQNGRPRLDLAVYRDDVYAHADQIARVLNGKALTRRGYTWDLVDPVTLRERGTFEDGRLMPEAGAYKALVIHTGGRGPTARDAMPAEAAEHVLALARQGLPVVFLGKLPQRGAGFADHGGEDRRLKAALDDLLALRNVRRASRESELPEALEALGVAPDFAPADDAGILAVHRRTPKGDVWFLFNDSPEAVETTASFVTKGRPWEVDLWDGGSAPALEYRRNGRTGRVALPLRLGPGETKLLAFGPWRITRLTVRRSQAQRTRVQGRRLVLEDDRPGRRVARLSNRRAVVLSVPKLPAPVEVRDWHLTVTAVGPAGPTRHELELDALRDWRDLPAIGSASGTGEYVARVKVPGDWVGRGRGVRLSVGRAGGAVEVFVNGERATWQDTAGMQVPVDHLLRAGDNEIRIVVTTNRINTMVALARSELDPYYRLWTLRQTQRYGLLGPVTLRPFARTSVVLPRARRAKSRR